MDRPWFPCACSLAAAGVGFLVFRRLQRLESVIEALAGQDSSAYHNEEERVVSRRSSSKMLGRRRVKSLSGDGTQVTAKFVRVVLTGGPCGGKSTSLTQVAERLNEVGMRAFMLPEASTLMFTAGHPFPGGASAAAMRAWESSKMRLQEALEEEFSGAARDSDVPTVILCDRGMVDSQAYASPEDWLMLLEESGWTEEGLMDRYDVVVHLTSAAYGAEEFFTTANNEARRESREEARQVDDRIKAAWKDHPQIVVVDNATDFQTKINRVFEAVAREVMPRFGLSLPSGLSAASAPGTFEITKGDIFDVWPDLADSPASLTYTFLAGSTDRTLRRRSRGQTTTFILSTREGPSKYFCEDIGGPTAKTPVTRTQRIRRQLYNDLMPERCADLSVVNVTRHTHVEDGIRVELDEVTSPISQRLLRIDVQPDQISSFGAWVDALGLIDVSSQQEKYTIRGIARNKAPPGEVSPGFRRNRSTPSVC